MKRVILCSIFLIACATYSFAQFSRDSVINRVVVNNREFIIERRGYYGRVEAYFVDEQNIHTKREYRLYYRSKELVYRGSLPRDQWIKAVKQALSANTINTWADDDNLSIGILYDINGTIINVDFSYNSNNDDMNLNKIPIKELALLSIAIKNEAKMDMGETLYPKPNDKYEFAGRNYLLNVKKLLNNTPDYYLNKTINIDNDPYIAKDSSTYYRNVYRITQFFCEKAIIADKTKRNINSKVNIDGRNFLIETDEHGYYAYFEDEKQVNGRPIIDADTCIDSGWYEIIRPTREDWVNVIESSISDETLEHINDEYMFYGNITIDCTGAIRQVQFYSGISYGIWHSDLKLFPAFINGNMYDIWSIISPEELAQFAVNIEKTLRYKITPEHGHILKKNECRVLKVPLNIRSILHNENYYI